MKHGLHFYATEEDIAPVIDEVEAKFPLQYVLMGNFDRNELIVFRKRNELPNLGTARSESAVSCLTYLVLSMNAQLAVRLIVGEQGEDRFAIDQLLNPDSITFSPGGLWKPDVLLYGRVATVHNTDVTKDLTGIFGREIRRRFQKIKAFWVGPAASSLLDSGARLTAAEQSPNSFDLARPQPRDKVHFQRHPRLPERSRPWTSWRSAIILHEVQGASASAWEAGLDQT